jgi:hypothetical protein
MTDHGSLQSPRSIRCFTSAVRSDHNLPQHENAAGFGSGNPCRSPASTAGRRSPIDPRDSFYLSRCVVFLAGRYFQHPRSRKILFKRALYLKFYLA